MTTSHKPKTPSLSLKERRQYHALECVDCHRLIPPGRGMVDRLSPGGAVLCEPCLRFRRQIEVRIVELCAVPAGCSKEKIAEDLERFGVPPEMTEAARLRLHESGRLVSGGRSK